MLQDLLASVEVVVDAEGRKKRALLPWSEWEALLGYLQTTEEQFPTPEFVMELENARVEMERGEYVKFEDIRRNV
ncbi:MAG TPA: hypothetical protein G4N96_13540 [Chloroflexi bacterium]|nr:hypothetical protein [Chloroflexota bacterium]